MAGAALLGEVVTGRWRPGIGDPTAVGWVTVAVYFLAVCACLRAARREAAANRRAALWVGLAVLMAALGVNKQLDLQTLVTEVGRDVLRSWGEYERRREYQVLFIGCVAAACAVLVPVSLWLIRDNLRARWPTVLGLIFLLGFIVIRAASFHHIDALLAARLGGVTWNGVFELGGIALIAVGALRVRSPSAPSPGPQSEQHRA